MPWSSMASTMDTVSNTYINNGMHIAADGSSCPGGPSAVSGSRPGLEAEVDHTGCADVAESRPGLGEVDHSGYIDVAGSLPGLDEVDLSGSTDIFTFAEPRIFGRNLQSLRTETRFEQFVLELDLLEYWDVLMLNETWRESATEMIEFGDGHLFLGRGGTKGHAGVAFILHKRWKTRLKAFKPISDRVDYLGLNIHGRKLRLVSLYMPHSDYPDTSVQVVYDTLSGWRHEARQLRRRLLVFGDWNAEVGQRAVGEDPEIIGNYRNGFRNVRG